MTVTLFFDILQISLKINNKGVEKRISHWVNDSKRAGDGARSVIKPHEWHFWSCKHIVSYKRILFDVKFVKNLEGGLPLMADNLGGTAV